jgi:hypothetical protein
MAKQRMGGPDDNREAPVEATLARRRVRLVPLVAVLAMGLCLSACDRCGDFFWQKPGACKSGPAPN